MKMNLLIRHALPNHASPQCIFCNSVPKPVRHVLFECAISYQFLMEYMKWIGVTIVLNSEPARSITHFSKLLKGKRVKTFFVCS